MGLSSLPCAAIYLCACTLAAARLDPPPLIHSDEVAAAETELADSADALPLEEDNETLDTDDGRPCLEHPAEEKFFDRVGLRLDSFDGFLHTLTELPLQEVLSEVSNLWSNWSKPLQMHRYSVTAKGPAGIVDFAMRNVSCSGRPDGALGGYGARAAHLLCMNEKGSLGSLANACANADEDICKSKLQHACAWDRKHQRCRGLCGVAVDQDVELQQEQCSKRQACEWDSKKQNCFPKNPWFSPWYPWIPSKTYDLQTKSFAARFEVIVERWVGRGSVVGDWLIRHDVSAQYEWRACHFKVSKYEAFAFDYDDEKLTIENVGPELDSWRVFYELLAFFFLIFAPIVADSFVAWCMAGSAGGAVILSIIIILMVLRRFDSKKGAAIIGGFALGLQQMISRLWSYVARPLFIAYVVCMGLGFVYCWRNRPTKQLKHFLQYSLQAIGCYLAYSAVSDSGAGLLAVGLQLILYRIYLKFEDLLSGMFHAFILPSLRRVPGAEGWLIRSGILTQTHLYAANNYMAGEAVQYQPFRSSSGRVFDNYATVEPEEPPGYATPRERMDAFHERGQALARREVEKLQSTPEFKRYLERKAAEDKYKCLRRWYHIIVYVLLPISISVAAMSYANVIPPIPRTEEVTAWVTNAWAQAVGELGLDELHM